jgi:hypothetical protein
MSAEANEVAMSKRFGAVLRTNSDIICELAYERREVSRNLAKLKEAIEANPQFVSEHHKDLWVKQAKAMQAYVDVLSERIKDLIDSDT